MHPLFSLLALKLEQLTSKIYTTNYIKICDVLFKKHYFKKFETNKKIIKLNSKLEVTIPILCKYCPLIIVIDKRISLLR